MFDFNLLFVFWFFVISNVFLGLGGLIFNEWNVIIYKYERIIKFLLSGYVDGCE